MNPCMYQLSGGGCNMGTLAPRWGCKKRIWGSLCGLMPRESSSQPGGNPPGDQELKSSERDQSASLNQSSAWQ